MKYSIAFIGKGIQPFLLINSHRYLQNVFVCHWCKYCF